MNRRICAAMLCFAFFGLSACGGTDKLGDTNLTADGEVGVAGGVSGSSSASGGSPSSDNNVEGASSSSSNYELRGLYLGYTVQRNTSTNYKAKTSVGGFLPPIKASSSNYELRQLSRLNDQE